MFMKVQVNLKEKIDMKDSRIRTHDPEDPVHVYYSNQ